MPLTPLELHDEYRKMQVTLDDASTVTVDVHKYQLNGNNNGDALKEKDTLIYNKMSGEAKKNKGQVMVGTVDANAKKAEIAKCYMGKGTVEDLQMVLRLVSRYGLDTKHGGLQGYADKNLGLDCNGFVGNYTKRRGLTLGPSSDIETFRDKGTARAAISDVRDHDVIVWKHKSEGGYGHIAIIETALGQSMQAIGPVMAEVVPVWSSIAGAAMGMIPAPLAVPYAAATAAALDKLSRGIRVLESTGGVGMRDSVYWLEKVEKKKGDKLPTFTVLRPDKKTAGKFGKTEVYIVDLGL